MNRSRREIKTPKRFDEEPFQATRESVTPAKVTLPKVQKVVETSGFKVSLPKKQKQPETSQSVREVREVVQDDIPPPPKIQRPTKEPKPPKDQRTPTQEIPVPPPKIQRTPREPRQSKEHRPPPLELAIPPKIHRLPKEYRPPKEHRALAYEAVVPNVVLPFWDARTAAEEHEDDNVKELVHCQCGIGEELGLMVQCETCLTWQHAHCLGIDKEEDAPDGYTCQACSDPRFARESMRWAYDQDWLLKGRMKRFSCDRNPLEAKDIDELNKINRLIDDALRIYRLLHSLRVKARLLATASDDDPELKLFRVQWPAADLPGTSIQPIVSNHEATPDDCREHLKQHIEHVEKYIGGELKNIEEQMSAFEKEDSSDVNSKARLSFKSLRGDLQIMRSYIAQTD